MKNFLFYTILATTLNAHAKSVNQLKLNCEVDYKVIKSNYYYQPPHHRVPGIAGINQEVEILSIHGKDCYKLNDLYNINLYHGQKLKNHILVNPHDTKPIDLELGKTFTKNVSQSFLYSSNGELPLFPLLHEEKVSIFNLQGNLNSKDVYGSKKPNELTEAEKVKLMNNIMSLINYGKNLESSNNTFFQLLMNFQFEEEINQKEFLNLAVLSFNNALKDKSSLATFSKAQTLGQAINKLSNELDGTKWKTKLEVLISNPLLFDDQILSWSSSEKNKAPIVTSDELEYFLSESLDIVLKLKEVPQVSEARTLMYQYKSAAKSILKHSQLSTINWLGVKYDVSENSKQLAEEIINI